MIWFTKLSCGFRKSGGGIHPGPLINPYIEELFRSHLSAGFCGFVTGKGSRRYASWRENVISIWFRFMICEALTILIYHTEGSSPSGAVLRQGRGAGSLWKGRDTFRSKFPSSPSRLLNPWKRHLHNHCTAIFFIRSWTSRQGLELHFGFRLPRSVELLVYWRLTLIFWKQWSCVCFFFGHGISVSTIMWWSVWYMFWTTCKSKFSTHFPHWNDIGRESQMWIVRLFFCHQIYFLPSLSLLKWFL